MTDPHTSPTPPPRSLDQVERRLQAIHTQFRRLDPQAWAPVELEILYRLIHEMNVAARNLSLSGVASAAHRMEQRVATLMDGGPPDTPDWQALLQAKEALDQAGRMTTTVDDPEEQAASAPPHDVHTRVVIVDADAQLRDRLAAVLVDAGYTAVALPDLDALHDHLAAPESEPPGALILDIDCLGSGAEGLIEDSALGRDGHVPMIVTASRDDLNQRLRAHRLGARHYLLKPVDSAHLREILGPLTGRQPARPYRVLMAERGTPHLDSHSSPLRAAGMEVRTLNQPDRLLDTLDAFCPDVVVLGQRIAATEGTDLVTVLRQRDPQAALPIVCLASPQPDEAGHPATALPGVEHQPPSDGTGQFITRIADLAEQTRRSRCLHQRLQHVLYERQREHHALDHHAIVSVADASGRIIEVNDHFCTASGYSRHELLGQNHRIVKSGEHPPEFYRRLWETISRGEVWQGEICNRRKDGSLYWVESTITPFLDDQGLPYQYVSIRTETTHVKAAATELRRRHAMQQTITRVATGFLGVRTPDADAAFQRALKTIGRHMEADRAYLFLYDLDRRTMTNTHEWCAPGVDAQREHLHDVPLERMGWSTPLLEQHTEVVVPDIEQIPDPVEREFLRSQEIRSMLLIPLQRRGKTIGLLGFDAVTEPRAWRGDEIAGLRVLAQMLSNTLIRHQSEQELHQRETDLRLRNEALESAPSGILIVDAVAPDMPIIHANQSFERITGYPIEDSTGHNCRFLQRDDLDQPGLREVSRAIREERSAHVLVRNYRKDGELFWNELRLSPVHSKEGRLTHYIGIIDDVTERIRTTHALELSEQRLRRSQLYANIGSWEWDIDSGEILWTEQVAPLFGLPEGQHAVAFDEFLKRVHPSDRSALVEAVDASIEQDAPYSIEHRVVWPDGQVRWVQERGAVVRDEQARALQMLGVILDIDERKRTELALAERERELREAQSLAGVGNWSLSFRNKVMTWSDQTYRIFGYAPGAIQPSAELAYKAIHPEDLSRVLCSQEELKQTGEQDITHRLVQPDGSVRHVHTRARGIQDSEGRICALVGTLQDVTEQVEAEQALIRARDAASRASRAKSVFLSSMSHELRTPMNAILGFGQLLDYDDSLGPEQREHVGEILRAGQHLLDLINEVLDLARVESGRIELDIGPVAIAAVATECLGLVASQARQREITLYNHVPEDLEVHADRLRLKQVLLNLVSNAVKYNHSGGEVRLRAEMVDSKVRISVSDTGPGIGSERIEQLFQPFERLGAEHSGAEGTGIGLTISRRLIEMMDGRIEVDSEPGQGSRFWIDLPRVPGSDRDAPEPARRHSTEPG
ncbi:MAG: PAS domain-containing protein [Pseudomonadota bacterium]